MFGLDSFLPRMDADGGTGEGKTAGPGDKFDGPLLGRIVVRWTSYLDRLERTYWLGPAWGAIIGPGPCLARAWVPKVRRACIRARRWDCPKPMSVSSGSSARCPVEWTIPWLVSRDESIETGGEFGPTYFSILEPSPHSLGHEATRVYPSDRYVCSPRSDRD